MWLCNIIDWVKVVCPTQHKWVISEMFLPANCLARYCGQYLQPMSSSSIIIKQIWNQTRAIGSSSSYSSGSTTWMLGSTPPRRMAFSIARAALRFASFFDFPTAALNTQYTKQNNVSIKRKLTKWQVLAVADEPCCMAEVKIYIYLHNNCLQCFDTVGWAAGRASGL